MSINSTVIPDFIPGFIPGLDFNSSTGSEGYVSFGDTPGPEVKNSRLGGDFIFTGFTGTDFSLISFHRTGGGKVLPADIN